LIKLIHQCTYNIPPAVVASCCECTHHMPPPHAPPPGPGCNHRKMNIRSYRSSDHRPARPMHLSCDLWVVRQVNYSIIGSGSLGTVSTCGSAVRIRNRWTGFLCKLGTWWAVEKIYPPSFQERVAAIKFWLTTNNHHDLITAMQNPWRGPRRSVGRLVTDLSSVHTVRAPLVRRFLKIVWQSSFSYGPNVKMSEEAIKTMFLLLLDSSTNLISASYWGEYM
jgi:hypothetical protein